MFYRPKDPHFLEYLKTKNGNKKGKEPEKKKEATEPVKIPVVVGALYKAVMTSFDNLRPLGKSFLVTIDASSRTNKTNCITSKNVTCLEAAAIIALSILKVEKRVIIANFDGKSITVLSIDKSK